MGPRRDKHGGWETLLGERVDPGWASFSWLTSRALLDSANDRIAKAIHDLVGPRRNAWMAASARPASSRSSPA